MWHLLRAVEEHDGPLTLPTPLRESQYFASLAHTIIGQQISTAAARTIRARFKEAFPTITPDTIIESHTQLPALGISAQKQRYLAALATAWPTLPTTDFSKMSNQAIIAELTTISGIGVWSAEMFLLFTLGRTNVFSYRDLGLMQSLYHYYQYHPHYTRKIAHTVDRWHPYESVASLTLWRARDTKTPLV